jgi:serine phosphatase RsbU (regulator of sigma subunit)
MRFLLSILLVAFIFAIVPVRAQDKVTERLIMQLDEMKADTNKVLLLCKLANNFYFYAKSGHDSVDIRKGKHYANDALELSTKLKYQSGVAKAWLELGNLEYEVGNKVKAFEDFQTTLKIAEQIPADEVAAKAANKIGYIHCFIMNNPERSKEYFFKALEFYKRLNDTKAIARSLVNIGDVYSRLGDKNKGIEYQMEAYKISSDVKDSSTMVIIMGNLGDCYTALMQYDKAIKFVTRARKIQMLRHDIGGEKYNDERLGVIYLKMKDYKNAEFYLLSAYEFAEKNNYAELILNTSEPLYELYKERNDKSKADFYQLKYLSLKDSVNNLEKLSSIAEMENHKALERVEAEKEKELMISNMKRAEEKKMQNMVTGFVVFSFVTVLIFSIIIFRRFKFSKRQNEIIQLQKEEVEQKNELIEEKQKEIMDSIHYAKRIQSALLAHKDYIDSHLKENFILFKPKDIVSGDFYWATHRDNKFYLASCDSTGHGVPGAFMSLLNIGFLGEAIKEKNILEPHRILNYVRERLIEGISKEGQKDGFDGILICLDKQTNKITYAAANNAPVVVRDGKLLELECDRMPVGQGGNNESFKLFTFDTKPSDVFYLYTDGYPDQFGGTKGKKFMYKRFNDLLLSISSRPLKEQSELLATEFERWRGGHEQIDDVCVIAVKF